MAKWTEAQTPTPAANFQYWTLYFDGLMMLKGLGAGIVIITPKGEKLRYVLQLHFQATNNVAEYEALLHGLRITVSLGIRGLHAQDDFDLVIQHVMMVWECRDPTMQAYCQEVCKLEGKFDRLKLSLVLRRDSEATDELAKMGFTCETILDGIFLQRLHAPSIKLELAAESTVPKPMESKADSTPHEVMVINPDWRPGPFLDFLLRDILPRDQIEVWHIVRCSKAYTIIAV